MRKINAAFILILFGLLLVNCDEAAYKTPVAESLSPGSQVYNTPTFTLSVKGSDFINGSTVYFNGKAVPTTYQGSSQLDAVISTDALRDVIPSGNHLDLSEFPLSIPVYVKTPPPGGGKSETLNFIVMNKFSFREPLQISQLTRPIDHYRMIFNDTDDAVEIGMYSNFEEGEGEDAVKNVSLYWLNSRGGVDSFGPPTIVESMNDFPYNKHLVTDLFSSFNNIPYIFKQSYSESDNKSNISFSFTTIEGGSFDASFTFIDSESQFLNFEAEPYGNGNFFAVWADLSENEEKEQHLDLFYKFVRNNGHINPDPMKLNQHDLAHHTMGLSIDSEAAVYIAWSEKNPTSGAEEIFYKFSSDFGEDFSDNLVIYQPAEKTTKVRGITSILDNYGKNIYIACWTEDSGDTGHLKLIFLTGDKKANNTFTAYQVSAFSDLDINNPPTISLKVDSVGNIYIAVSDSQSVGFLFRSSNGGMTFSQVVDPLEHNAVGPYILTLNREGKPMFVFARIPDKGESDETEPKYPELFFLKTNE